MSNAKGGKGNSENRIKDENMSLTKGEDEVRKIWKESFEDLYNINTQKLVVFNMCGFDRIRRGNYFGGKPIGRAEVEVGMGKLKNGKAAVKDEITRKMIKGGGDRVVDWIWRLCNTPFERGVVPENWRSAVIVPMYKGKGVWTECKSYRLFSVVKKIYAGILVESP